MEFSSAKIKQLFFEQYNSLSEQDIIDINNKSASGDINNVVVGLNDHCFGVWLMEESPEVNYQLFYVNGKNKLEGDFLQLSLNMPEKEDLTFFFASFLAHNYEGLDPIDTYNTFQNRTRSLLEKIGFLTVTNLELADLHDPVVCAVTYRGIIQINFIDKLTIYRQLFKYDNKRKMKVDGNFIYLMLNKRNNHIKIGKSKTPNFREKTLQSEEPDIQLIACWEAPAHQERVLHAQFADHRTRGEWFKLRLADLKMIKEAMKEYEL